MKILHCCLSCFYIDGYGYQENILPRINKENGHDVLIVASGENYINGALGLSPYNQYETEYQVPIIRIPYLKILTTAVGRKIRIFPSFKRILEAYKPDVILFHGTCGYEILTLAKYKRKHKEVKIYVDSHEDYNNSARTLFARKTLYKYYKFCLRKSLKCIEKILYITEETKDFLLSEFGIPEEILEYYPLGGIIPTWNNYAETRQKTRRELEIADADILFIHSGKLSVKKKTENILKAFENIKRDDICLIIVGKADDVVDKQISHAIATDKRIRFLGWKNEKELNALLCAADVYIQPGTQSATMQNALCHSCAVLLFPYKSHALFVDGNGAYTSNEKDIESFINNIKVEEIMKMEKRSLEIAKQYLDYYKLAGRLYQQSK